MKMLTRWIVRRWFLSCVKRAQRKYGMIPSDGTFTTATFRQAVSEWLWYQPTSTWCRYVLSWGGADELSGGCHWRYPAAEIGESNATKDNPQ